jgi:hypothetical protein
MESLVSYLRGHGVLIPDIGIMALAASFRAMRTLWPYDSD